MRHGVHLIFFGLCVAVLSACAPPNPNGAEDQLRAQLEPRLRWAGVSQSCIDSLDSAQLTTLRAQTLKSPRTMRDQMRRDLELRTFAQKNCESP